MSRQLGFAPADEWTTTVLIPETGNAYPMLDSGVHTSITGKAGIYKVEPPDPETAEGVATVWIHLGGDNHVATHGLALTRAVGDDGRELKTKLWSVDDLYRFERPGEGKVYRYAIHPPASGASLAGTTVTLTVGVAPLQKLEFITRSTPAAAF